MLEGEIAALLDEHDGWDWVLEGVGPWIDYDAGIKCSCRTRIPPKDEGSAEDWHREHVSEVIGALIERRFEKHYGVWVKDGGTGSEKIIQANTRRAAEMFGEMNPQHQTKVMACWASDWEED